MRFPRKRRPPLAHPLPIDVEPSPDNERRSDRRRRAPVDVDARIAAIAEHQDGLVTRDELLALALTPSAIGGRVRSKRLHIVFRGVYSVGHPVLTRRARLRAALLAIGPRAVLSHRTAAALWGLLKGYPETIDVLVDGTPPRPRIGLTAHRTRRPFEPVVRHGLRITSPLRTLQDLRGQLSPAEHARACSEALVLKLVTQEELDAAGLTDPDIAPSASAFSRRFQVLLRRAGLPRPVAEHQIGRYTADFAWLDAKVIVETDGYGAHGHRSAFEHDRARDAYLMARGWLVVRVTWRRLRKEPIRVMTELAQILATRTAA
jgi:very-short-patch-repair endonuclease